LIEPNAEFVFVGRFGLTHRLAPRAVVREGSATVHTHAVCRARRMPIIKVYGPSGRSLARWTSRGDARPVGRSPCWQAAMAYAERLAGLLFAFVRLLTV
jgi:hypothetical protein